MPDYRQFCPVAMAAEVLCRRWTLILLRELIAGSTRFNDLRRGVPRMSTAVLSRRLRELEAAGIVTRSRCGAGGVHEYRLTAAGEDLKSVVEAVGFWGQRWVDADLSLEKLDASLLMWDMRRNLVPDPLPKRRSVIQFHFDGSPTGDADWWLIVDADGEVDLCSIDPGFPVDLLVRVPLREMTAIWMGLSEIEAERASGRLRTDGDPAIDGCMSDWLGRSPFAAEAKLAAV